MRKMSGQRSPGIFARSWDANIAIRKSYNPVLFICIRRETVKTDIIKPEDKSQLIDRKYGDNTDETDFMLWRFKYMGI